MREGVAGIRIEDGNLPGSILVMSTLTTVMLRCNLVSSVTTDRSTDPPLRRVIMTS
jgi:hypothetical protein